MPSCHDSLINDTPPVFQALAKFWNENGPNGFLLPWIWFDPSSRSLRRHSGLQACPLSWCGDTRSGFDSVWIQGDLPDLCAEWETWACWEMFRLFSCRWPQQDLILPWRACFVSQRQETTSALAYLWPPERRVVQCSPMLQCQYHVSSLVHPIHLLVIRADREMPCSSWHRHLLKPVRCRGRHCTLVGNWALDAVMGVTSDKTGPIPISPPWPCPNWHNFSCSKRWLGGVLWLRIPGFIL